MHNLLILFIVVSACADRYHPGRTAPAFEPPRNQAELDPSFWYKEAFAAINRRQEEPVYDEIAKNVVMFLGDGLSVPTLASARTLRGQRAGRTGEEEQLAFEKFPVTGLAKTYCVDAQIADSACTATAYLCGVKNNYDTLGVSAKVQKYDCAASADPANQLESIAAWALAAGKSAGIVTTTRITHASPAGAYAKSAYREWENDGRIRYAGYDPSVCPDIADQLINSFPGNQFQVILGGGRREFRPNTTRDEEDALGRRWDGRDLIEEWRTHRQEAGHSHMYAWNRPQLLQATANPPDYLLGLFEDGHMQYAAEARKAGNDEPTLAEMTEAAIRVLSKNPNGFFLFVEGGRIDHAHHDNLIYLALDETLEFSDAVERAESLLPGTDTLLVLTADHSHVLAFNGYSPRGNPILGRSIDYIGVDGVPYMTLSYTNGPGYREYVNNRRVDVTEDEGIESVRTAITVLTVKLPPNSTAAFWSGGKTAGSTTWMAPVEVPLEWETHGGDDVAVFAKGPQQALFTGLYEQSHIPHIMAHAACIGPAAENRKVCAAPSASSPSDTLARFAAASSIALLKSMSSSLHL